MKDLNFLLERNRLWADGIKQSDPQFFSKLSAQQSPEYLWIGCSDSRVPANQIVGLLPGEVFVHRNIANLVVHSDLNCLSVIQFAVEVLKVKHIIVCGHYECGGVRAALENSDHGLIDNWLRHIKDIYRVHQVQMEATSSAQEKQDRLCEINVIEQVANVCHTTVVQNAWKAGQQLTVHGWIYSVGDGILKDLKVSITGADEIADIHRLA
ncbi:MAG: carbonate dehydratase [Gammaproteobacteria bacterium]|nr:carbonate dehydratase [Pseudomonadales bacterium]MCP5347476.1 carbonate dehydratase [Pseudomonadales bacterium]